jgi:hypothetical protein
MTQIDKVSRLTWCGGSLGARSLVLFADDLLPHDANITHHEETHISQRFRECLIRDAFSVYIKTEFLSLSSAAV